MNTEILASATEELRELLAAAMPESVLVQRPAAFDSRRPTVCLHLYRITDDPAMRNSGRTPGSDRRLVLHYLVLAGGSEARCEPHRLLGGVIAALDANPVLPSGATVTANDLSIEDAAHVRDGNGVEPGVLMCTWVVRSVSASASPALQG